MTDKIYPAFIAAMQTRMARIQVGDACTVGTDIGPVVSQAQLEQDLAYVEIGKAEGATLLCGGERLQRDCIAGPTRTAEAEGGQAGADRSRGDDDDGMPGQSERGDLGTECLDDISSDGARLVGERGGSDLGDDDHRSVLLVLEVETTDPHDVALYITIVSGSLSIIISVATVIAVLGHFFKKPK